MYYERWPDVDEPPGEFQYERWPEGDPDELVVAFEGFLMALKAGFDKTKTALAPFIRAGVIHTRGYRRMPELLDEMMGKGYIVYPSPDWKAFEEAYTFEPLPFSSLDYKTLPNGRLMPIITHNSGPRKDPFEIEAGVTQWKRRVRASIPIPLVADRRCDACGVAAEYDDLEAILLDRDWVHVCKHESVCCARYRLGMTPRQYSCFLRAYKMISPTR